MTSIYKFYPGIGFQNINLKKLNENFELLRSDIIALHVSEAGSISAGSKGLLYVPCDIQICGWVIGAYTASSMVIDVRKCTSDNYPSTVSITGGNKIVLSNSLLGVSSVLPEWSTNICEGSWLEFVFESVSGTDKADVILKVCR